MGLQLGGLLQDELTLLAGVQPVGGGAGEVIDPPVMGQRVVDREGYSGAYMRI